MAEFKFLEGRDLRQLEELDRVIAAAALAHNEE